MSSAEFTPVSVPESSYASGVINAPAMSVPSSLSEFLLCFLSFLCVGHKVCTWIKSRRAGVSFRFYKYSSPSGCPYRVKRLSACFLPELWLLQTVASSLSKT